MNCLVHPNTEHLLYVKSLIFTRCIIALLLFLFSVYCKKILSTPVVYRLFINMN